jgi:glyoxylase-like metal-dependent hydrolase (beta-lactamase superfamily II)
MKLTDKIHLLQIDFEITINPEKKLPRFVNVIIIFGSRITLIDTGVKGSERAIFDYIEQNGRDKSELGLVILSHSHPDHIGSAHSIREATGCKIMTHCAEKNWIENIEEQNRQRPVPGFFNLVDRPVKIDGFISDSDVLKADEDLTLEVIHSPGHSAGSLNIRFCEDRILFTADSVPLRNDIPNYDNFRELKVSLEAIKNRDDFDILLTSWTPPLLDRESISRLITDGEEYLMKIDQAVGECYTNKEAADPCRCTVEKLGLPPFLANPLVDRAFRSHF